MKRRIVNLPMRATGFIQKKKSTGDKSKDNINVTNNYYLYKNNDYFLKDSIGCKNTGGSRQLFGDY